MTSQEIAALLAHKFADKILASLPDTKHPRIEVDVKDWRTIAEFLRREPTLQLDWLANLSGMDYVADEKLAVVYDLYSFDLRHLFAVKIFCPRAQPQVPSVVDLWPAANWHEREAFDMFGITFLHHPDLRRILCPDDWVGFPLRKDYVFPREYQGIPASAEVEWQPK